jgi:Cu2+-exporting ATPase
LPVEELQDLPHGGITGRVGGRQLLAGSAALVESEVGRLSAWAEKLVQTSADSGRTPVVLAVDGVVRAVLAFGDRVRPEAKRQLARLSQLGYQFEIASGDHQRVVDSVARELGIAFEAAHGGMSPEAKLERVNQLRASGQRVVMVGDGVNDAGAMAAATVGFAVHGGAETCLKAADVFATRSGLTPIFDAVLGSRRTLAAIRRGIALSLIYNVVGVALAVTGVLSPLLAAIMMPLSSISVVSLALRARSFEREKQ